jgi:hypothetical protein
MSNKKSRLTVGFFIKHFKNNYWFLKYSLMVQQELLQQQEQLQQEQLQQEQLLQQEQPQQELPLEQLQQQELLQQVFRHRQLKQVLIVQLIEQNVSFFILTMMN